jgi:hypothetical protein
MEKYRCIWCNDSDQKELTCRKCGKNIDKYLDCEFGIVAVDLILCKTECIRHIIFNIFQQK